MEAVHTKETLPDHVIYTFFVLKASSEDSGTYECSVTHEASGKVRASSVALTVFGKHSLCTRQSRIYINKVHKKLMMPSSSTLVDDLPTRMSRLHKCTRRIRWWAKSDFGFTSVFRWMSVENVPSSDLRLQPALL